MALLTTEDVLHKRFQPTKFREGYDQDEVDDFLDEVAETLRVVTAENDELREKLAAAERRIAELSQGGEIHVSEPIAAPEVSSVKDPTPDVSAFAGTTEADPEGATSMLRLAQRLHDEYVANGRKEGDRLVAEAHVEGQRIIREAEEQHSRTLAKLEQERSLLERKIEELREFERDYRSSLKTYLEGLVAHVNDGNLDRPTLG